MCRLFALRAAEPRDAVGPLLADPHALRTQSLCDKERGWEHPDGWGIAYYGPEGLPQVERRTTAASRDPAYEAAARQACSDTIVAHVRKASVGTVALNNTHPFTFGCWTFAHNGTVPDLVLGKIEECIANPFRAHRQGQTDSEAVFLWLLSEMKSFGLDPEGASHDAEAVAALMDEVLRPLVQWCCDAGSKSDVPPGLNLLLTDGKALVVSKWNRSLAWLRQPAAVQIASEATNDGPWEKIDNGDLVWVDADLKTGVQSFAVGS